MSVAFHYASLRKWCQQEELGRVIQRSVTSSPVEMRTTAVKKPAVKTSCHGCSCREDALVNPCQNSRKPRQTTTPTQSGYLRSHQQVPTAATPTRATISDYVHGWTAVRCRIPTHPYVHGWTAVRCRIPTHPYEHGWTTPTLSGYLRAIASAHGSASQPHTTVQENISQMKTFQNQALSFVEDSVRGDIINTEEFPFGISLLYLYRRLQQRRHSPGDRLSDYTIV